MMDVVDLFSRYIKNFFDKLHLDGERDGKREGGTGREREGAENKVWQQQV